MSTKRDTIIQARVAADIKEASADVLRCIGLSMSEAMELFLRRVIDDQRLPFHEVLED
jgi:addiction module RelB/DinJ family antitoxin